MPPTPAVQDPLLPRNETELLQRRPPSHRDGVFPRRLLLPGERVLFETRPSSLLNGGWAVGILAFLALSSLAVGLVALLGIGQLAAVAGTDPAAAAAALAFVGAIWWGGLLAVAVRSRRSTAYALTDRRILLARGFWSTDFEFAGLDEIVGMTMPDGSPREVVFEALVPGAGASGTRRVVLRWNSLRAGPRTYDFAQQTFALAARLRASEAQALRKRTELQADRITCEYCGNLVAYDPDGEIPRTCPRCTAPLPAPSVAPVAGIVSSAQVRSDRQHIPILRPVVFLGRQAIDWFRPVPLLWGIVAGAGILTVGVQAGPLGQSSLLFAGLAAVLLIAVPLAFVLWAQAIRKWAAAVRTLRASLPAGDPWHRGTVRALRIRLWAGVGGYLGSIALIIGGTWIVVPYSLGPAAGSPASFDTMLLFALVVAATISALVIGQAALVSSYPLIAAGSGVIEIDRTFRRGKLLGFASLLVAFWPLVGIAALFYLDPGAPPTAVPYLWIPALAGPAGLLFSLGLTARGFEAWTNLADRVASYGTGPTLRFASAFDSVGSTSFVDPGGLAYGQVADRFSWRLPSRRRRAVFAAILGSSFVVAAVTVAVVDGWIPGLGPHPTAAAAAPPLPAPLVLVPQGATWSLPAQHYQSYRFGVNRTVTISANFSATSPVAGYVLDSNQFNIWLGFGGALYGGYFTTGNVTDGWIHDTLTSPDRYYVVLVNFDPTQAAVATWTTACIVTYDR